MRPAFGSVRQAAAFAFLLLVILLSPVLVGKSLLPSREQIYSSFWWANGAYPYIDEQIYREKGDIDIAFIGASHIWNGIDTPYVQNQLSQRLGRPATVRTFGWGGAGYDTLYLVTQDLLQHRKVHMIVYYDVYEVWDVPNGQAARLFRFADDAHDLGGLPLLKKIDYYLASILGMPRNLLSMVRSNQPVDFSSRTKSLWETLKHADDIVERLGSLRTRNGYTATPTSSGTSFEEYAPLTTATSSDVRIYSEATKDDFYFTNDLPSWQLHFARKFADLSRQYGCRIVLLHLPMFAERHDPKIGEKEFWPGAFGLNLDMVGIPSVKLFGNLTDEQIEKLYEDPGHFNENGQKYFTTLVTPALVELYAAPNSH
ncbi:MAG: divergent polysaccharide deacetylase family protein [Methylacidiphilales bacterium]|nr:divergent polysaccharide deacetylase family protein [Candidatus Methylacidiphilales bacterium]